MARLAFLSALVCTLAATVSSSPVTINAINVDKRSSTGRGTWFDVGLGACGYTDVESSAVVAISHDIYDSGAYCNRYIHIENTETGVVQYGQVRDECMGCDAGAIDLSSSLFESLGADLSQGVITVEWYFEDEGFSP